MSVNENQVHDDIKCGAKTRAGTPCQQKPGWGTNHVGEGRCKLHGGRSTGPKNQSNNKNAVSTGERESIVFDFLDDEEKELLNQIDLDKLKQIDNEIKLIDIRLRRMMKRIQKLNKDDMSVSNHKAGEERDAHTDITESVDSLSKIQNIEDAITRVQGQKLRLIESKHKLEMDNNIIGETRKAQLEQIKVKTEKLKGVSSNIEDMSELRRLLLNGSD